MTWRDTQSGETVTGQVMSPGEAGDTWYVSTDRSGHTGEYHVLSRSGKKDTGYTYSVNGAATDLRPADGPGEQLPLAELPEADSVPARPVPPYADWLPMGSGLAKVREPIAVTVGEMGPRFGPAEAAFVPRVEADGKVIAEFDAVESRAEASSGTSKRCRRRRAVPASVKPRTSRPPNGS